MSVFRSSIVAATLAGAFMLSPAGAGAETAQITDTFAIHYLQAGEGDIPIVFIPGWTMSSEVYVRQLEHFRDSKRYRAIAYDPRGQGLSTKTVEGHTYQQHGRDLAAFLDALDLHGVVLAGWSYGVLAQFAYIDQFGAERVRALVLIDGSPKSSGADNTTEWVWYRKDDSDGFRQWFTMGPLGDRDAFDAEFAGWMLEDASPENVRWAGEISRQTSGTVAAVLNETGAYLDYADHLKALEGQKPLLYVVREEWGDVVRGWAEANTPSATVVPMGKHLMFWERSDEFNQVLDAFLAELE